ncbi:Uncharacterised protein [uncultured archaeon]|nr:Uncharacterised protein [uncultured archaeon]
MTIEIKLPTEIEATIRANEHLDLLVRKRLENQIQKDIKDDIFLLMAFNDLLKDSEIKEEDVNDLDHRMKRDLMEKLGWR